MINEDFLKCLEVAKTLTQSSDIDVLIPAAHKIYTAANNAPDKQKKLLLETAKSWVIPEKLSDFLSNVSIMHPTKGAIPLVLYPYQERFCDFLQGAQTHKYAVLARQMGLTMVLAGHALHDAVINPDQCIVIVSNKYKGAVEIMERIRFMADNCAVNLPRVVTYNKSEISFANGSRIMARAFSACALRGISVSTLIIDNAAYMAHSKEDGFYQSIMPTLCTGGKLISTSAAGSTKGMFYHQWKGARDYPSDHAATFECTWREHPERNDDWAKPFIYALGEQKFAREYECEFRDI